MPNPAPSFPRTDAQHYGIVALLENTRVRLPLKAVECRFHIMDDVISVEIDQAFHNNQAKALDCLYSFPLPGEAAAYRCEMILGDRVIRAKVEERKEARRIVQEKKALGHRVALVEVERDNLFTLSLSNMQPQEIVVVRFAYFQSLERLNDELSCMIPFCPGIRYIPGRPLLRGSRGQGTVQDTDQVPDASRITPPRMDQFHPDATSLHIHGTFSHPLGQYEFVTSPSHTLVLREEAGKLQVTVPQGGGSFPDRDFVLRWKDVPSRTSTFEAWGQQVHHETDTDGTTYAMVRLQAPAAQETTATGQDFYFLVDRSGSMDGTKWTQASRAFREFLKVLGQNDRAWVTFFESTYQDLCEWPLDPKELLADRTVQQLESLGTLGGTELLPALDHVLEAIDEHSQDRRSVIILITDGQVGNETEVLRRLKKRKSALPVIALGIDTAVNEAFLQQLARQQRGQCFLRTPDDDIVGLVAQLGDRLKVPVLTDITAGEGWEFPADQPRDLYAREIVTAVLRGPGGIRQLTLYGKGASGEQQSYNFELQESPSEAVSLLWARRRIQQLQSSANGANTADKAALTSEMLTLARSFNILCEGAAFLAVDESQKGEVAKVEVYQPSYEPHQPGVAAAAG
ncbi:MAG: VIT domain-containing protein, partial [Candidatus Methylacidiphilales bacterium]